MAFLWTPMDPYGLPMDPYGPPYGLPMDPYGNGPPMDPQWTPYGPERLSGNSLTRTTCFTKGGVHSGDSIVGVP